MTDITNIILHGEIEGLAKTNGIFGDMTEMSKVDTRMLQRSTVQLQNNPQIKTGKIYAENIAWNNSCSYQGDTQFLTYLSHNNPVLPGVNILEVPFNEQNGDIAFPCFVSSGMLSGCVYAWFLLKGKIVFLHAGADAGHSVENEDKEERHCKERADIFNGLRYCIVEGDRTELEKEPVNVYLSTEELLKKVQGLVKAGQIIYPADDEEKEDMGMIQTMSYRPQTGSAVGECLCIITKSDEGIKVSGMMTEKEYSTFKNRQGRILKVDESGNEIR